MGSESEFQDRSWLVGNGAEWNWLPQLILFTQINEWIVLELNKI
jgi:hypothetical protein